MKISPINLTTFKSRIIDAHTHTGHWDRPDNSRYEIGDIFELSPKNDTIEKIIVSNLDCMKEGENNEPLLDEIKGNELLLDESENDERVIPLATCEPKTGDVKNIEQLFEKHPDRFYGLKFHPDSHQIMASDPLLDPYLKFAQKNELPCVFHCGINYKPNSPDFVDEEFRYSSPIEVYEAAKKIPDTPVIMAHFGAGGPKVHNIALDVLLKSIENNDAKLYADISWVDINTSKGEKPNLINAIKQLQNTSKGDMTDRLIFGTDAPIAEFSKDKSTYENFVAEIKEAIRNDDELAPNADEILDNLFYKNAQKLFKISE